MDLRAAIGHHFKHKRMQHFWCHQLQPLSWVKAILPWRSDMPSSKNHLLQTYFLQIQMEAALLEIDLVNTQKKALLSGSYAVQRNLASLLISTWRKCLS